MNSQPDAKSGASELPVEKPLEGGSSNSVPLVGAKSGELQIDSLLKSDENVNETKEGVNDPAENENNTSKIKVEENSSTKSSQAVSEDVQTSADGIKITMKTDDITDDSTPENVTTAENSECVIPNSTNNNSEHSDVLKTDPNGKGTDSTLTSGNGSDTPGAALAGEKDIQRNGANDPSDYMSEDESTHEKDKVEVRGLPKFYGYGELKKFLADRLEFSFRLVKPARKNSPWVIVCFKNEEGKLAAMQKLNRLTWKGNMLTASIAASTPAPSNNKRKLEVTEGVGQDGKKARMNDDEKLRNLVTPYWNLSYEEQIEKKREFIKKTMCNFADQIIKVNPMLKTWIGRQKSKYEGMACKLLDIRKSPNCDGYRNKCEFTVGINEETKQRMVGFRLGSYVQGHIGIGPIDSLKHIPQRMKETVKVFEKFVKNSPREPYNAETHTGYWKQLNLRLSTLDELMAVVVVNSKGESPEELGLVKVEVKTFFESEEGKALKLNSLYFQAVGKREVGKIPPMEHMLGERHIFESLSGLKFRISPETFFQVNTSGAGVLYSAVSELIDPNPSTTIIDICCGTGTIGLSLAEKCGQVLGLEVVEPAIEDAKANAAQNNITNCEFFTGRAEEILPYVLRKANGKSVYAIVDPPRNGLHQKSIAALREAELVKQVVYVSCDPNSALKNFIDLVHKTTKTNRGHPLVPICAIPVDMFPHTGHCEVIILFHRINPSNLPKPIPNESEDVAVVRASLLQQTHRPKPVHPPKPADPPKPPELVKKRTNVTQTGKNPAGSNNPGNKNRLNSSASLHQVKQDDKFKKMPRKRPPRYARLLARGCPIPEGASRQGVTNARESSNKQSEFHQTTNLSVPRSRNMGVTKGRIGRGGIRDGGRGRGRFREEEEEEIQFSRRNNPGGRGFREKSPQQWSEGAGSSRRFRDDKPNIRSANVPQRGGQWTRPQREMERPGGHQGMGNNSRRSGWKDEERDRVGQRSRFSPLPDIRDMRRSGGIHHGEEQWRRERGREVVSPPRLDERNFVREESRVMFLDRPQPVAQQVEMIGRPVVVGDKYGVLLNGSGRLNTGEVLLITSKNQMYDGDGRVWVNSNEGPPKMILQQKEMSLLPKPWEPERHSSPTFIKPSSPMKSHDNCPGVHVLGRPMDDRQGTGVWFMESSGDAMPQRWRGVDGIIMPKTHAIRDAPNIPDTNISNFTFRRRDMDDRHPNNPSPATHSGISSNTPQILDQAFSFRSPQGGCVSNTYTLEPSREVQTNMEYSRNIPQQSSMYRKVSHSMVIQNSGQSVAVDNFGNQQFRPSSFSQNMSPLMNLNVHEPQKSSSVVFMQPVSSHSHVSDMPLGHRMPPDIRSSHSVPDSGGSWNDKGGKRWRGSRPDPPIQRQHW